MTAKKVLGLVTARGNSTRLPGKNIMEFLGKPMIAWTIEAGLQSGAFDRFILSTDDPQIAEIGKKYGIDVPFLRPSQFATETSSSYDAVKHAVEWLRDNEGYENDNIVLLEPPSPGRRPFHIREVAEIICTNDSIDSLMGISLLPNHYHPHKVVSKQSDGTILRFNGSKLIRETLVRNQDFETAYFTNSTIYAFKKANLFATSNPGLWGDRVHGYVMDNKYAFDIDTPHDLRFAEISMKMLLEEEAS